MGERRRPLDRDLLGRFLNPDSVAVVGASTNRAGMAGRAWVNLERSGFTGKLHLVNPARSMVGGHRAYPSVGHIDDEVDAAIVLVPSSAVAAAVDDCVRHGIQAITVCTSGFSELGEEGRAIQREFAGRARMSGSRLLGPNCIGVLNVTDNYVAVPTYNVTSVLTPGGVTMLSHSGGMAVNLFNRAQGRGIGIRAMITLGNEADIDMAEMTEALLEDEATTVIALFMERLVDGPRFVRAARRAHAAGKPIVALKVGRSEAGRRSVEGHTGTLAGESEVFSGVLAQTGVVEVATLDELLNTAHVLDTLPRPSGRKVGVYTVSGGESSYFADLASPLGLEFPDPDACTVDELKQMVKFGVPGNPFDATGQIIGNPDFVRSSLDVFCADPGFDMLALVTATWGAPDAESLLPHLVASADAATVPTVVCSWSARNLTERAQEILRDANVPVFETSDEATVALANLARYWLDHDHVAAPTQALPSATPDPGGAPAGVSSGALDEHRAKGLLADAGLPMVGEILAADHAAAVAAFERLGGPVVLKGLARGVVHKSELGLVRIGIADVARLRRELDALDAAVTTHDLQLDGYLVQEQAAGVEIIVGFTVDATFGPVVMVGAGGTLAEHHRDVRFLAIPATRAEIGAALRALACWPVLEGVRGTQPDVSALLDFVERFAAFVDGARGWLVAVDCNPVIVRERGAGVVAVDAMLVAGQVAPS